MRNADKDRVATEVVDRWCSFQDAFAAESSTKQTDWSACSSVGSIPTSRGTSLRVCNMRSPEGHELVPAARRQSAPSFNSP